MVHYRLYKPGQSVTLPANVADGETINLNYVEQSYGQRVSDLIWCVA